MKKNNFMFKIDEILKLDKNRNDKKIKKVKIYFIIFIISLVLSMVFTSLIKTNNSMIGSSISPEINELRDKLFREQEIGKNLQQQITLQEKIIDKHREDIAKTDKRLQELKNEISENNIKLGYTELTGKGIRITLKDGEDKKIKTDDPTQMIVHDTDILDIVNVLRNAGAEAISVNGQRIVQKTPISCIGTVIKINDEKVGAPYVISAIGNQDYLESAINIPGGVAKILEKYGISLTLERVNNIKIPKYKGVYSDEYIG